MKRSLLLIVAMAIVMTVVSFVGCNSEVPEDVNLASVSFAPSVPKSLNQDGKAQEVNANVGDFKWQYVVSEQPITISDSTGWQNFYDDFASDNPTTGLGSIKNLIKNHEYYFALRAYSTGTDSLLEWEGKTYSSTKLAARNTTVTITVNPVGLGTIYFNFTAPVYSEWNLVKSGSTTISSPTDKFVVSWTKMADKNTSGTNTYEAVLNDDADEFVVNTVKDNLPILLKAGTYLFTVKQQTYNEDTAEYEDVSGRKQVLIVDAQSGVDTVIAGSLDSTSYQVFTYEGGAATDKYGIEVEMIHNDGDINTLNVIARTNDGIEKYIRQYDRVYVYHGEFLILDFASATDKYDIYVNGAKILTNTDLTSDSGLPGLTFYKKTVTGDDGEYYTDCSYLNNLNSGNKTINAYGKENVDYLVTIVSEGKSKTFTVVGRNDELNKGKAKGTFTEEELIQEGSNTITISYTHNFKDPNDIDITSGIKASSALQILQDNLPANATDSARNYLTLILSVIEKEVTTVNASYEISLSAFIECKDSNNKTFFTSSKDVTTLTDYITVTISTAPKLTEVRVFHSDVEMTSTTNLEYAYTTDTDHPGYFNYMDFKQYGKLSLKTKSFSPFTSKYKMAESHLVKFMVKDGSGYSEFSRQTVEHNCKATTPWVKNATVSYVWYKDKDLTSIWDFTFDVVTKDMELYGAVSSFTPAQDSVMIKYNRQYSGWVDFTATYSGTTWLEMINYQSDNNLSTLGTWKTDADGYIYAVVSGEEAYLYNNYGGKVNISEYVVRLSNNPGYRYYLRTSFKIDFKANYTSCTEIFASKTVVDGLSIGSLPQPKGNYSPMHFDGWYFRSSAPLGDAVTASTTANKWNSRTLYGRWTGPKVVFMDTAGTSILKEVILNGIGDTVGSEYIDYPSDTLGGRGWSYGAFFGWQENDSDDYFYSNTPVSKDITVLYQRWNEIYWSNVKYDYCKVAGTTNEVDVCFTPRSMLAKVYGKYQASPDGPYQGHSGGENDEVGKFYVSEWANGNSIEAQSYDFMVKTYASVEGSSVYFYPVPETMIWGGANYWIEYITETDFGNKVYPVLKSNAAKGFNSYVDGLYIVMPEDKVFTGVAIASSQSNSVTVITSDTDKEHPVQMDYYGSNTQVTVYATYEINATLVTSTLDKTSPSDLSLATTTQQTVKLSSGPVHRQLNDYLIRTAKKGYEPDTISSISQYSDTEQVWYKKSDMTDQFSYKAYSDSPSGDINYKDFTIYSRDLPVYSVDYVLSGTFTYINDSEVEYLATTNTNLPSSYVYSKELQLPVNDNLQREDNYHPYYFFLEGWSENGFKQSNVVQDTDYISKIPATAYGDKKFYMVWRVGSY